MDKYLKQIEIDFGEWGDIFTPYDLFKENNSPFKRLCEKGYSRANSRLVFSVCSDDINRLRERITIENSLKEQFGEEFHLGNLAAYPIGGLSGIIAASHHTPNIFGGEESKTSNLIFFINPHVGLVITTDEVIYGHTFRPSQIRSTNCCEPIMEFLHYLRHAESFKDIKKISDDMDDPMKVLLFQEFLNNHRQEVEELLKIFEMNHLIIETTKLNYKIVINKFNSILKKFLEMEEFEGNYAVMGGITVNTKDMDYLIFRDYALNSIPK